MFPLTLNHIRHTFLQTDQPLSGVFLLIQFIHFRRADRLGKRRSEDRDNTAKPGSDGGDE